MTTRKPAWNDTENRAIVALYFAMLDNATAGKPYNKAALIRTAQQYADPSDTSVEIADWFAGFAGKLMHRSRGSIEAKLMNCTAAHRDLAPHAVTMSEHGYRPLPNYQASLKAAIAERLAEDDELTQVMTGFGATA